MTPHIIMILLSIALILSLAALFISVLYNKRQWTKFDRLLMDFQKGEYHTLDQQELMETRESKSLSLLRRILNTAYSKETQATDEKNHVMELISDLSHQLKTPLANIVMNMDLLCENTLTEEEQREFLLHTRSQADKMQWLMEDLLKASRLENGMIDFSAQNTGIKETIAKAVSAVFAQASARQIIISVTEFADFTLYHNPKWTAEALTNILDNAIKYSPAGSHIQITISRLDIYTKITIADEGIGIPENEYNQIFKRFYRSSAVKQQEGCGLGLYLAQLILQCEKGYITVSSKVGAGSSFSVFLLNPLLAEINAAKHHNG
ncbi:MAG: HAMP domain-containing histidine kinase [Ruminococcus sp.]|nr:HAMP domain-containing histidine kinase [Ruminococcus sp.]